MKPDTCRILVLRLLEPALTELREGREGERLVCVVRGVEQALSAIAGLENRPDLLVVEAAGDDERAVAACRRLAGLSAGERPPLLLVLDGDGSACDELAEAADLCLVRPDARVLRSALGLLLRATRSEGRARADLEQATAAAEQRRLQLQALIENVSSGVALVEGSGRFTLYNRQFLAMFGLAPDSDIHNVNSQDWSAWQVVDETGRLLAVDEHPVRRAALTLQPVRNQLVGVRWPARRSLLWMLISAEPLLGRSGALEHLICTYHDVTERRKAEERLTLANAQLAEADRHKSEFLAVLSHELRNPLAPLRNSAYILEHSAPGGVQARRAQAVIDRQLRQLTRLVDDLLEVTRISQGKVRLHPEIIELNALVRRCADDHREQFTGAGVELELDVTGTPLHVNGDPARLTQVIGNLLSNAAKFTPSGGRARLSLAAGSDRRAIVRVRDDGMGIPAELLPKVFQPFVQGESTLDRTRGGLGLGLAVLKGLVLLHGGSVEAHSEGHSRGAEFVVYLPIAPVAEERRSPERLRGRAQPARRFLVVEDNVDAAETLKTVLELDGHAVVVAHTGSEGIEAARQTRPDVVLCDIGLPGMDGFEVARTLRADPALACTTLVALSGYALPEDIDKAREAGFDRHLAKPVDPEDLVGI